MPGAGARTASPDDVTRTWITSARENEKVSLHGESRQRYNQTVRRIGQRQSEEVQGAAGVSLWSDSSAA